MSAPQDRNRRAFLQAALGFASGALWLKLSGCGPEPDDASGAVDLTRLFRDRQAMRELGAALLREHPELADADRLEERLFEAPRWQGASPARAGALFVEQIREEFARGDTLEAQGWVLAATEARLYALAELRQRAR